MAEWLKGDLKERSCGAEWILLTNVFPYNISLFVLHWKELEELMQQLYSAASKVDLTFGLPDLSSALRQIQSQYDSIAAKNLQVWCL